LQRDGYLGSRVALVLVGVDPVEDTRQRLTALAKHAGAAPGAFHFATGSAARVQRILAAYGISVTFHHGSHVDPDHTVAIYLIDPRGRIRYDYGLFYASDVIARIAEQLADQTTGKSITR